MSQEADPLWKVIIKSYDEGYQVGFMYGYQQCADRAKDLIEDLQIAEYMCTQPPPEVEISEAARIRLCKILVDELQRRNK